MTTRRNFLHTGICATGAALSGCATRQNMKAPALAGDFAWGALLHLGTNMWGDWVPYGKYPTSLEEEKKMLKEGTIGGKKGKLYVREYMSADWNCWRGSLEEMRKQGMNIVFIDVGEAYAYPSHPELWVKGSLDFDEMRKELAWIRSLGLEPVPKLNFSAGHDQWLKTYHYMTSSPKYYEMVADIIRDTCEVFGTPRYFHLGFDEEMYAACGRRRLCVMRSKELWWKDCLFCVREVEKNGSRAMLWSDKICGGRQEFLERMPKSVLQMPWYYGTDFSDKKLTWDPKFEKCHTWDVQANLAASFIVLADAGYDIMACTSNHKCPEAAEAMVKFCKNRISPERLKGCITAPWRFSIPSGYKRVLDGVRLLGEAKRKYFT